MVRLVLDNEVLHRYEEYYFGLYPLRRVKPIKRPVHESINKWALMSRIQVNSLKQHWNDFIVWWITDLGLKDLKIDKCEITFITYMPTRRRCDPDNLVPKFILDGLVNAGLIVDDSGQYIKKLSIVAEYDKNNPRTEIIIEKENEYENH